MGRLCYFYIGHDANLKARLLWQNLNYHWAEYDDEGICSNIPFMAKCTLEVSVRLEAASTWFFSNL